MIVEISSSTVYDESLINPIFHRDMAFYNSEAIFPKEWGNNKPFSNENRDKMKMMSRQYRYYTNSLISVFINKLNKIILDVFTK